MTMPVLTQKYNYRITETRLKKFYSVMNQAILMSVKDNGDFKYWDDYFVKEQKDENSHAVTDENGNEIDQNNLTDAAFNKYLKPYLKIINTKEVKDYNNANRIIYYLGDGSAFAFRNSQNRDIEFFPAKAEQCLQLSSNARSGNCSFSFIFYPIEDKPVMWKYHYNKGMEPYLYEWNGDENKLVSGATYSCGNTGGYCTALIMRNNWQIPDNYPKKIRY